MLEQQTNYNGLETFVNLKNLQAQSRLFLDLEPVMPQLAFSLFQVYATETPINFPIPYVSAAAAIPTKTCRMPEYNTLRPVINVIAAPMMNNPTALTARLI